MFLNVKLQSTCGFQHLWYTTRLKYSDNTEKSLYEGIRLKINSKHIHNSQCQTLPKNHCLTLKPGWKNRPIPGNSR